MTAQATYRVGRDEHWVTAVPKKILSMLDMSTNIERALEGVEEKPNGLVSLSMLPFALLALFGFGWFALYFDINSSWGAMDGIRTRIMDMASAGLLPFAQNPDGSENVSKAQLIAFLIGLIPFVLTLMPTAVEGIGSRFYDIDIAPLQWSTWFFIGFDLVTDAPRVNEEMTPLWPVLVGMQSPTVFDYLNPRVLGGVILYDVVWVGALMCASFFLELATIVMFWVVIALLWKSFGYWTLRFLFGKNKRHSSTIGSRSEQPKDAGRGPGRDVRSDKNNRREQFRQQQSRRAESDDDDE